MGTTHGSLFPKLAALVALGLATLAPLPAWSQEEPAGATVTGEVEVGGQGVTGDNWGDSRFQNYKEERPGAFGRAEVATEFGDGRYFLDGRARFGTEDDQSYGASAGRYNRFRIELEYQEFPDIDGGGVGRTLHVQTAPGVLELPDTLQNDIEAVGTGAPRAAALEAAYANAFPVSLRSIVKDARAGIFFRATPETELNVGYVIRRKKGSEPWGMGFGSPGGTFVSVAAPVDEETHEITAGVQYARDTFAVRLDYTGSFFENDLEALVVDNPLFGPPDTATGPSRGRAAVDPDNQAHTFALSGRWTVPVGVPTSLSSTISYGIRRQNEPFVPHTINTAIPDPTGLLTLPKNDLDGEVHTRLGFLRLASRPTNRLGTSVFYRIFDYDNKTDPILFPGHVVNDLGSAPAAPIESHALDFLKQNAGVKLSYQVARPVTARLGLEWERWDRDEEREVRKTDEYIGKLGADWRAARWLLVKADTRVGVRQGHGYETDTALNNVLLRKYDEANRKLYRGDLLTRVQATEDVAVTLRGGYGLEDFDDTELGLRDTRRWNAGTDVEYRPLPWLGVTTFYAFDHLRYDQRSRWVPAPAGPDDPINDWSSVSSDYYHTLGVTGDVVIIAETLDFSLSYVIQDAKTKTRSASVPGTTNVAADGGNAPDWPDIEDTWHRIVAALRYHVMRNMSVKAEYRFEKYNMANFRLDDLDPVEPSSNVTGSGVVNPTSDVFLPMGNLDYEAHIMALSLIYRF